MKKKEKKKRHVERTAHFLGAPQPPPSHVCVYVRRSSFIAREKRRDKDGGVAWWPLYQLLNSPFLSLSHSLLGCVCVCIYFLRLFSPPPQKKVRHVESPHNNGDDVTQHITIFITNKWNQLINMWTPKTQIELLAKSRQIFPFFLFGMRKSKLIWHFSHVGFRFVSLKKKIFGFQGERPVSWLPIPAYNGRPISSPPTGK